jgi:hypothetical protein
MIATYLIRLTALLLFVTQLKAKLTDDPHDMRMEDFEICRKQWNKKEMRYVLKFSRSGEVIKTSDALHRTQRFTPVNLLSEAAYDPTSFFSYSLFAFRKGNKGFSNSRDVVGKWFLSPSGRITFSTKTDGIIERYSAEVRYFLV